MKKNILKGTVLSLLLLSLASCKQVNKALVSPDTSLPVVVSEDAYFEPVVSLDELARSAGLDSVSTSEKLDALSKIPLQKLDFLYSKQGKSTWFYEEKLSLNSFSNDQYLQLLRTVYSDTTPVNQRDQQRATYALQYSLYEALFYSPKTTFESNLKTYAYSKSFLLSAVKHSPSLIRYIPSSLPYYMDVVIASLKAYPNSFENLPLRSKLLDAPLIQLYRSKDALPQSDIRYKTRALEYARLELSKKFLSADGMSLQFVPEFKKDSPSLVYSAVSNTKEAIQFASSRIQDAYRLGALSAVRKLPETVPSEAGSVVSELKVSSGSKLILEFDLKDSVVSDLALIGSIESKKGRSLSSLYHLATVGAYGDFYVAVFQPKGTSYLATLVYKKANQALLMYDYPATYSPKTPNSVWSKDDSGVFSSDAFTVLGVSVLPSRLLEIDFSRKTGEVVKNYRLKETAKGGFELVAL